MTMTNAFIAKFGEGKVYTKSMLRILALFPVQLKQKEVSGTRGFTLTLQAESGIMGRMYIPTQEERYSKVARLTLLLCLLLPPAVVMWLAEIADLATCAYAFLLPVAMPLDWLGFNKVAALCISALLQGIVFFWLCVSRKLSAKTKCTIAVTWGMGFALILRLLIAFSIYRAVKGM